MLSFWCYLILSTLLGGSRKTPYLMFLTGFLLTCLSCYNGMVKKHYSMVTAVYLISNYWRHKAFFENKRFVICNGFYVDYPRRVIIVNMSFGIYLHYGYQAYINFWFLYRHFFSWIGKRRNFLKSYRFKPIKAIFGTVYSLH